MLTLMNQVFSSLKFDVLLLIFRFSLAKSSNF